MSAENEAFPNTFRRGITAAMVLITELHVPSITDRIEGEKGIAYTRDPESFQDGDYMGILRECRCGVILDGYYDYVEHLKEVLTKAATP